MPTFKLSVINDEITQDFGRACEVAAQDFGLHLIEIRAMWGKNIMRLDAKEIDEARKILEKYKLRVSSIASPIFKVDWPGAPTSKFSPKRDQFGADFTFEQQDELLERGFELMRVFKVDRIRIFDFWRLDDQQPYRAAIDAKLIEASKKAAKRGVTLLLENEPSCNTATGAEAARTLAAVRSPKLKLNWDPGNAANRGEIAYPDGYGRLPKNRIGYIHCKDVVRKDNKYEWMKMGGGIIDYVGQYRALKKDGYRGVVSLETHWRGAGTPEESSRQSMAGMKELLRRAGAM
ncbi:MAG TPA: sugar phosphate isomerase/epimerase family protein [Pyrinomonadaceae bacterium]|jgi:sugar phosphate isomerase/epimerase